MQKQRQLALKTLGTVAVTDDNQSSLDLGTRKTVAMLVYLACSEQPVGRETLASLFWEDVPDTNARASLSVALSQLRKRLPGYIVASRDTVALNREQPLAVDAEIFTRSWDNWRQAQSGPERSTEAALAILEKTLALYHGPFLAGLSSSGGTAFEEWVRFERERLERIVRRVLEELARAYLHRGEYRRGTEHARRLLQLDPFRESSHRLLMLLLAAQGQRAAALAHYDACRQLLQEELGLTPGAEIQALVERLAAPVPHYPLPARPSFTAGRNTDLGRIRQRLLDTQCRLLVITGSGGTGKSHLALEIAWSLRDHFLSGGVCFVPLAVHRSTADLSVAMARVLGLECEDTETVFERLVYYLRDKEMLLVLDGFEHLLPNAHLLSALLKHAPNLKLLVTSRERLGVPEECLYVLSGLSYPPMPPGQTVSLAQLATEYGAIDLFRQEAWKFGVAISEEQDELAAVVRICKLLDGLPLGIQLAASWLRLLAPAEIAGELAQRIDFLVASAHDQVEREQNLAALVSHTLDGLSASERRVYLRLSVFAGSFDREAAECVTEADLSVLRLLLDKSLLRQATEELANEERRPRFVLPRLLQQHAREQLRKQPDEEAVAFKRHSAYYLAYLQQREAALCGGHTRDLHEIEVESANICEAWERAVAHGEQQWLARAADGLGEYYWQRGRYQEGEERFSRAAQMMRQSAHGDTLLSQLLAWQAVFTAIRGDSENGRELLLESRTILTRTAHNSPAIHAFVYLHLSRLVARQNLKEAERLCEQALLLYQEAGDGRGIGLVLAQRAEMAKRRGRQRDALTDYASGYHYLRAAGDLRSSADLLSAWANAAAAQGQLEQAEDLARRAHGLYQHLNSQVHESNVLQQLGRLLLWQGKWDEAIVLLDKSLRSYQVMKYQRRLPRAHASLALALTNKGDYPAARGHLELASDLAVEMEDEASEARALWLNGWIRLAAGRYHEAKEQLSESAGVYWHLGERVELSHALAALACTELHLDNLLKAKTWLVAALELAREVRYPYSALAAVLTAAALLTVREAPEWAVELFTFAFHHPVAGQSKLVHDTFHRFLTSASATLSAAAVAAAQARGATLELWEIVDVLIDVLSAPSWHNEAEVQRVEIISAV